MTHDELEAMYQAKGLLDSHQSITIHAQEFTIYSNRMPSSTKKRSS